MDSSKKSTQTAPLMIAVGPKDKENLANPDVIRKCKRNSTKSPKSSCLKNRLRNTNKSAEMIKNQMNNITSVGKVTAEDLISTGSPGDGYWEQLAESRKVALEATLKENMDLHMKINSLDYEVTLLKSMLAEARQTIHTLLEIAEESSDGNYEEDDSERNDNDGDDSIVDASFTSV